MLEDFVEMVGFELWEGKKKNIKTSRYGCIREIRTFGKEKDHEQRHKSEGVKTKNDMFNGQRVQQLFL